jgi:hypothetical protein
MFKVSPAAQSDCLAADRQDQEDTSPKLMPASGLSQDSSAHLTWQTVKEMSEISLYLNQTCYGPAIRL